MLATMEPVALVVEKEEKFLSDWKLKIMYCL